MGTDVLNNGVVSEAFVGPVPPTTEAILQRFGAARDQAESAKAELEESERLLAEIREAHNAAQAEYRSAYDALRGVMPHLPPLADPKPVVATTRKRSKGSAADAGFRILQEEGGPKSAAELAKLALDKKYWSSNGLTPDSTMAAQIYTEILREGEASRFVKVGKALFALKS